MEKKMKFEDAMNRLSEIVRTLESGDASLDDSITLFEEGMKLSKHCAEILSKAEQKVRFLQAEQAKEPNEDDAPGI